ncbi:hypothetical protein GRI89_05660 [Altererythrobacter salegens]|uniref:Uncharacterized protein n=1 Tax=Croceibacterium salegens TaxID=1737568 RepID=A0A6I4ST01_9SPHN|nr:hypothetical protein [Croceibacterium salegens]MXO59023.1 hypothetical protein [Croceibacterium salegens]
MRKILLASVLLVAASTGVSAQEAPQLTPDQKVLVRCSAAFSLAANLQEHGDKSLGEIPELRARGMEYFVRAMASLMDSNSLSRAQVSALLKEEIKSLTKDDALARAMPGCLASLEASGL